MPENRVTLADSALVKLSAIRTLIVLMIAFGYASTMPLGQGSSEFFSHLGYEPSWIGISLLFFLSGFLGLRSLWRHGSSLKYLQSRVLRNGPLLVVVTLITVLIIYPIFGTPHGNLTDTIKTLTLYFLGTVSCLKAGAPLPGLLDDAKYMCLIQGAIWTLKWGLAAHIAVAVGHKFNLFARKSFILVIAIFSMLAYFALTFIYVNLNQPIPETILLGARLAWPFLAGMAVFSYWDRLPDSPLNNLAITGGFGLAAATSYYLLAWSPATEILLTCMWGMAVIAGLKLKPGALPWLNQWPALALAIYLINWPTAQILLLIFPDLGSWALIGLSLPITLALSWVAHKLVTGPSFSFAQRRVLPALPA